MAHAKNLARYGDVRPLLDLAVSTGECRYRAGSVKEMMATRHRLNTLRVLTEQADPNTPYAMLQIVLEKPQTLIISKRQLLGTIETEHTAEDLEPKRNAMEEAEEMMQNFLKELKNDET